MFLTLKFYFEYKLFNFEKLILIKKLKIKK